MALAVAGAVALAGGAFAATGGFASSDTPVKTLPAAVTAVDSGISSQYALFRQPTQESDGLKVSRGANRPLEFGENLDLAKRLTADSIYYAVPGKDSICLVNQNLGGICSRSPTEPTLLTEGLCTEDTPPGTFRLTALFPDGTDRVTVTYESGNPSKLDLPVKTNALEVDLPRAKTNPTISWTGRDGAESRTLPVPPGSMHCGPV